MNKNRQEVSASFSITADMLIGEVTTGKGYHKIPHWRDIPVEDWTEVLQEFDSRCPGQMKFNYLEAFRRSQWNNR